MAAGAGRVTQNDSLHILTYEIIDHSFTGPVEGRMIQEVETRGGKFCLPIPPKRTNIGNEGREMALRAHDRWDLFKAV